MPNSGSGFRWGAGEWLTLGAIAVLGLATIPQPFAWDQAMFALGARRLAEGGVLYRDYWDPKQPAMFAFYWLGGRLFGFSEAGEHAFELIYMLAFAAAVMAIVGARFGRGAGRIAAALSVGLFLAAETDGLHSQIECVAGLPILLTLAAAVRGSEEPERRPLWLVLSGIAGGVALAFKLILLPILAGFWVVALLDAAAAGIAALGIAVLAIAVGAALPLGASAAYFAAHDALAIAWWTSFVYPVVVLREAHEPRLHTLYLSARWFVLHWAPVIGAAVVGFARVRRFWSDRFTLGLASWLVLAAGVLLVQRLSYWPYHFLIFIVPLAAFAGPGLGLLGRMLESRWPSAIGRPALAAVLALIAFAPSLGPWAAQALAIARDGFALSPAAFQRELDRSNPGGVYPKIRAEVAFLGEPGAIPGAIWVVGNPLYYWLSGRDQAVARNGASFIDYASAEEWSRITASLEAAKPAYIYVHDEYGAFLPKRRDRAASFLALIGGEYQTVRRSAHGTWYARGAAGAAATSTPAGTP